MQVVFKVCAAEELLQAVLIQGHVQQLVHALQFWHHLASEGPSRRMKGYGMHVCTGLVHCVLTCLRQRSDRALAQDRAEFRTCVSSP